MQRAEPDDARVVQDCLDGEPGAWEVLVRRYGRLVRAIAARAGLEGDDAADLFQTVFVIVWRNLELLDRPAAVAGWIGTIARREAWRTKRRLGRDRGEVLAEDSAKGGPDAEAKIDQAQRVFLLARGLDALDERCRRLLDALFWRDPPPSYEELAQEIGVPIGSLGPTRRRCLEKLRSALTALGFGEP